MKQLTECVKELEQMFKAINEKWYAGKLEMPVITLAKGAKKVLGHFTTWKAWTDGTEKKHEINISADYTYRPIKETITTLMHECVHLFNFMNGVQDTSRSGNYHNTKFRDEAQKRGLIIEKVPTYGWTLTKLNPEAEAWIDENWTNEKLLYRTEPTSTGKKKKSNIYKHVCPYCGAIARTTKRLVLLCGNCSSEDDLIAMKMEEPDNNEED